MKTMRKDQRFPGEIRDRVKRPDPKMERFGEDEDYDPRETDLDDDDDTGSREYQDYDHPHRSNP